MRNLITNWRLDSWPLLIPMKDSSIFWLDYSVSIHFSLPRNFKRRQRCFFLSRSCYLKQPEKHQENFGKYFFPGRILHSSTQYVCQRLINIDLILTAPAAIFPQSMSLFHEKKNTHTSDVGSCIETLPKLHIQALYQARESVSTKTYKDFHVTCVGVVL